MVLRSQAEFQAAYGQCVNPEQMPIKGPPVDYTKAPEIDFESYMIVAVFMGLRTVGRCAVHVRDIVREGDGLRVEYEEVFGPPPGSPPDPPYATRCFTFAWVTRADGPVRFVKR
jgi:hypothetical protein